jgi:hypothetical protein
MIIIASIRPVGAFPTPFLVRRGQVRRGQVRRGQVRRGQVRRGQVRRGQVRRGQVRRGAIELLPVALDLAGRPNGDDLRVLVVVTGCAPAAQQIPGLVQLDLELTQPRVLSVRAHGAVLNASAKRVLFLDELGNVFLNRPVLHGHLHMATYPIVTATAAPPP